MRRLPFGVTLRLAAYRLLFPIILIFLLPSLVRRMVKRGNFRRNLGMRFGFFSERFRSELIGKRVIWLQSISVGETQIAVKLMRRWRTLDRDLHFVISVTTSTGFDIATRETAENVHVIYNPIDVGWIVKRTLRIVQPFALILVEGTWPVLVSETWKRGIPVALVARLSPRSARRFRRFRFVTGPIFSLLDAVFVQEPEEIGTWQELGARTDATVCSGAIKYDEPPAEHREPDHAKAQMLAGFGVLDSGLILLGGSTFRGEEVILTRVFIELRKRFPDLFLIIVPRHVERAPEILEALSPFGLKVSLRSQSQPEPSDILLVDSTGELRDWYAFASVVFIGKSLSSTGGQNPVEPALLGKPVIFGPHMENFAPIVKQWLKEDAAFQIANESELTAQIELLLQNPDLRRKMSETSLNAIQVHIGSTDRVIHHLKSILPL